MKVSVITCTWNSIAWLPQSIASVLSQDYSDIEYIFVDGGSTDGTLERIKLLPRSFVLIENVRGGISRAMNAGITAATGDVIAHLHSDDYYLSPTVISTVVSMLRGSESGWLVGQIMNDVDGRLEPVVSKRAEFNLTRFASGALFVPHPATFIKRSLFERVGMFDEGLRYAMDIDLWLRIAAVDEIPVETDQVLTAFRTHEGSVSNSNALASMREYFRVHLRYAHLTPFVFCAFMVRFALRYARRYSSERRARRLRPSSQ